MKVLFALSDTGSGHRSAAAAISAALQELGNGSVECRLLDVLCVTNFPLLRNSPTIYDNFSTRSLWFYNALFRATDGQIQMGFLSKLVFWWSQLNLVRAILETSPHVVVCTHPLVQRLVCYARASYRLPFHIVTAVTDPVTIHSAWVYPDIDFYFLPTDEATTVIHQRGFPPERTRQTGFPVHPKFVRYDRSPIEARRELDIAEEPFTLLLTSGGVGAGLIRSLVIALEQVYSNMQFLVVTGKNRTLYEELTRHVRNPLTHIYGFVNNMEVLMAASDIVVTKAGPGTLMEALVMRRPVILTEAIGLQEEGNIDFVNNRKLGYFCPTTDCIIEAVKTLTDPRHHAETVARLHNALPRDGALQIARVLLERFPEQRGGFSCTAR
jgi:UDP-N-acetylglucosamine:LPS N-acetylglucosamine transferase